MHTNDTPHLNNSEYSHLKTGGSLKDGWSFVMPSDDVLLHEEGVSCAFEDELDGHVREQTEALRNLYVSTRQSGSFLLRKDSAGGGVGDVGDLNDDDDDNDDYDYDGSNKMTFFIKRGLQVVGCISYNEEKSMISDLVVRPSARDGNLEKDLINAVIAHAKKEGKDEIFVSCNANDDEVKEAGGKKMYKELGFDGTTNKVDDNEEQVHELIMKLSI